MAIKVSPKGGHYFWPNGHRGIPEGGQQLGIFVPDYGCIIAGHIPGKCNFFPRLGGTEAAGLGANTENLYPVSMAVVEAQVENIKACLVRDKKMS